MIGVFDMQLTQKLAKEYKKASKKGKGEMLTEYCLLTEVSRNTSSKRFCKEIRDVCPRVLPKTTKYRKRGPRNKFNSIHKEIVRRCWELGGNICAERLHPMLTPYIDQLDIRGMLKFYSKEGIENASRGRRRCSRGRGAPPPGRNAPSHKGNAMI